MTTYAGSGHRPDKLGGYLNWPTTKAGLLAFARHQLRALGVTRVISGMAQGWDQVLAVAAITEGIPFTAAIPCRGFELRWPVETRFKYASILLRADHTHVVCDGDFAIWKLQKRNEWMVDQCGKVLALWDGSPGGTLNCIKYANKRGAEVKNVWDEWWSYSINGNCFGSVGPLQNGQ